MQDSFGRNINYLRVSVTDRCNLRCRYCMPDTGIRVINTCDILSYETIATVVREAVALGINKVRLTGGEPLVRRNIPGLVEMLAEIPGISDLSMTTNAQLLADYASDLVSAGLQRVNISLDTLDPRRYREITRGGDIRPVLAGIDAALQAGLAPVKLNCVVTRSANDSDARSVLEFGRKAGLEVRLIRIMHLATGIFHIVENGSGGDCPNCNRLRLTSNGYIRPCLFSNLAYDIKTMGIRQALLQTIRNKPATGKYCSDMDMHAIGG